MLWSYVHYSTISSHHITSHCIALPSHQYAVDCITLYHMTNCDYYTTLSLPFLLLNLILHLILHLISHPTQYQVTSDCIILYHIVLTFFLSYFSFSFLNSSLSLFLFLSFSSAPPLHLLTIRTRTWYVVFDDGISIMIWLLFQRCVSLFHLFLLIFDAL